MRALRQLPRLAAVELARAPGLAEGLEERAADAHCLADRLHLRAERGIGARELLEGEARELDDHVVECRLEARRCRAGEVVRNLVERVADCKLRGNLRDRVARRLRRQRRRARDARVHLDHPQLSGVALARELDVRPAALDADRTHHGGRGVAQLLIRVIGERHLRRDRDGVTGVHAHRVDVLDRADDHDVVLAVANDLELELVPPAHRLLHEHLADRALTEPPFNLPVELVDRLDEAATVAAERERRPDHRRQRDAAELVEARDDPRARNLQPHFAHRHAEELTVLRPFDDVEWCTDELDAELVEDAFECELAREIERCLPAHRRQQGIRPLPCEHVRHAFEIERLEIRAVRKPRVGHDRRRVRVHHDRAKAVLAQDLQRLAALRSRTHRPARSRSDRSRSGRSTRGHAAVAYATSSTHSRMIDHASCGPGPASGWN